MPELTEDQIARRLLDAEQNAPGTDGYAEIPVQPDTFLRCAAVLIPLTLYNDEWHLLFTRRTDRLESHKGQVSFPGGACEEGEVTPEQTALRETYEEIGVNPVDVKTLGRMSTLITISHFRVTPVVGIIPSPYTFKVAGFEVARLFTIPLLWLADQDHYWEFFRRNSDHSLIAYHPYDGELLWGATARMTVNFLKTIEMLK